MSSLGEYLSSLYFLFERMSLDSATKISTFANWVLLTSLVAGVLATFFIVKTADVKEQHWDKARDESKEEIAKANERARSLEKETAQARLETENLKARVSWRTIPPDSAATLERVLASSPGVVNLRYTDGDAEAMYLAIQISNVFAKAKWRVAPGSLKSANTLHVGISLPNSEGESAQVLRRAFSIAGIPFSENAVTEDGVSFNIVEIPGAPILMVGIKPPPPIP
jgi:hypothetical protein